MSENKIVYHEEVTSSKTPVFFLALAILCLALFLWRVNAAGVNCSTLILGVLFLFFLFYNLNYRRLVIDLIPQRLTLKFGIFSCSVRVENIAACAVDELPALMRYGGAGIHFMFIRRRYRASFNFLEHPRVVITLRQSAGPVQDISFSTCQPAELLRILRQALMQNPACPSIRS
jgi:hypothetical protein